MDSGPKGAGSLAVDNTDLAQSSLAANLEILVKQAGDFSGREGMQIQLVGDGDADGR